MQVSIGGLLLTLSLTAGDSEIVVGTSFGVVHRCAAHDLNMNTIVSASHLTGVRCVAFGKRSDLFASGSQGGELRVWDLSDYGCQAALKLPKSGGVLSVALVEADERTAASVGLGGAAVISGWEDGFIRCHDLQTLSRQIWYIASAHNGGVSTIAVHCSDSLQYMISGGIDGVVRIWRLSNRELVTQFAEHSKPVTRVLVDIMKPNIFHSTSLDQTVLSYDIKTQRRTVSHVVQRGQFMDMTQRLDSEQELVTCDGTGKLLHWDCDVRDPVVVVQDPSGLCLNRCSVSPSGRFIAFGGQDTVLKVLNIQSNAVVGLGQGHSGSIRTLYWTPDEKQIITGADDGCICIWNLFV